MKHHTFTSANGIDVEIIVTGSYNDDDSKDFDVIASNGYEASFEEVFDCETILEALEDNGIEFDENPRHFQEQVIDYVMIYEEMTMDEALDRQAKWEAEKTAENESLENANTLTISAEDGTEITITATDEWKETDGCWDSETCEWSDQYAREFRIEASNGYSDAILVFIDSEEIVDSLNENDITLSDATTNTLEAWVKEMMIHE